MQPSPHSFSLPSHLSLQQLAQMLFIDPAQATAYVAPLGQTKFDKSVGVILMNADLAVSMPEMGSMFRAQIKVRDAPLSLSSLI